MVDIREIVEKASDALFIIENRQLVYVNRAGETILAHYHFDLEKVMDVCEAKGCALHAIMEDCLNCEVKATFDPRAFSLNLVTKEERQVTFSASYSQISGVVYSLSIRNLTTQSKTDQLFQQKKLIAYVSQAHEKERKKIAQDLHDSLAQGVFSTLLETRKIKRDYQHEGELKVKLEQIEEQLIMSLDEIKTMALDLRPSALDDLGLASAITTLSHRLGETTGIDIHFMTHLRHTRFLEAIEITLFRVLQEALMNAIKYAKVEIIDVLLVEKDELLVLEVIDQGVGFLTESPEIQGTGMGLLHMKERVTSIGGQLTICSTNEGTQVKVVVPVKNEEDSHDKSTGCR
ncbi:sensor histidine kinase [uncultured Vagococcus sp.]|uniref:sensor histidine kinase n=1 Tax=uncultured Vagococcus sp. TaxID=189676 RepID=UPI0028D7BD10|nr:sensor histidine kinase [uncultured Vagococcus sp.]